MTAFFRPQRCHEGWGHGQIKVSLRTFAGAMSKGAFSFSSSCCIVVKGTSSENRANKDKRANSQPERDQEMLPITLDRGVSGSISIF